MVARIVPVRGLVEPFLDETAAGVLVVVPDPPGGPPVYTWEVPDRQCVGRLLAPQCIVIGVDESIQFSMDFSSPLALNDATIVIVNHVTAFDEGDLPTNLVPKATVALSADKTSVIFGIVIPDGSPEADFTVIAQIIDSAGNQYNGCGCLRVRHC